VERQALQSKFWQDVPLRSLVLCAGGVFCLFAPLGILAGQTYSETQVTVQEGDTLALVTDGLRPSCSSASAARPPLVLG